MKIVPNKDYRNQGIKILIKKKEYSLVRTTAKMAVYIDKNKKERKTKIENVEITQSSKKTEKTEDKEEIEPRYIGGHMPHVPQSCNHHRVFEDNWGIRWIDNLICSRCSKKNKCQRRKEFDKINTYKGLWEDLRNNNKE